jgi:23S rRNA pseudouridine1911/1915/1917 synthase
VPQKHFEITVSLEFDGFRLDKFLSTMPEVQSRNRAEILIAADHVMVNDKVARSSKKIKTGDLIKVSMPEVEKSELVPFDFDLEIVFEDKDIIVVNKPSGLVVHPAVGHRTDTLVNALMGREFEFAMGFDEDRPGIVHRLDKDTSGLLVVAKNESTHAALVQQFKARTVHRIYQAIVKSSGIEASGTIQSFIARHPTHRQKMASLKNIHSHIIRAASPPLSHGKWAVTHYTTLAKSASGFSLLQLKLETGRTHQIRVHLSEMGAGVADDSIYAPKLNLKDSTQLGLHALELGFVHPRTQEFLSFKKEWPEPMNKIIQTIFFGAGVDPA